MKLIKCPKCGEMYSDSYRTCPFCQEDEALKGRAAAPRRKVTRRRRAPSILGPAMVLVVVLAAVLVGVLLFGGKGNAEKPDDPAVVEPDPAPTTPLTLDQTTLNLNQAETATLTVTGAEDVLWTSSDTNVATVDDTGLVTAGIPGTATITASTVNGLTATCTVTVTGGKVTNVAIDASGETPELGGAAAETLADELTKAGSTAGVDAVSGATLTSNAVFTAMDSCLAQAGTGSAGAEDLTDGTYTSSAKGCLSDVEVTVTVSGGKVSEVAIDASGETPELGGAAAETLADALTKAGSTNGVDAVSGATLTSEAVFTAMNDCLSQAQ